MCEEHGEGALGPRWRVQESHRKSEVSKFSEGSNDDTNPRGFFVHEEGVKVHAYVEDRNIQVATLSIEDIVDPR